MLQPQQFLNKATGDNLKDKPHKRIWYKLGRFSVNQVYDFLHSLPPYMYNNIDLVASLLTTKVPKRSSIFRGSKCFCGDRDAQFLRARLNNE